MKKPLPSLDRLKEVLEYHPRSGKCISKTGTPIRPNEHGYLIIKIDGKLYYLHRIIWKMIYGDDPGPLAVDHANRDNSDNRKRNLRLSTNAQNLQNRRRHKTNTTGRKGVHIAHKRKDGVQCYKAEITANGVKHHLGTFTDLDEAQVKYMAAALRLHGSFACLN